MSTSRRAARVVAFAAVALLSRAALAADVAPPENWPRFRGPDGTGPLPAAAVVPATWDNTSVVWKTELKGRGQSSPVVWGDRVYLTTALENGRERLVLALDRATGKVVWERSAWKGEPEKSHAMNGWATPTCVTDGRHVWAWFGKGGAHCFAADGTHVWSRADLGTFETKNARGTAASPVLAGDLLVVNGDSETDPYLFGFDKATGKTVWRTDRPAAEGYSTPVLVAANGRPELVLNGDSFVAAYDPATGKERWRCKSFAGRGEPMPAVGPDGTLYLVNGLAADVYAVRPGGDGDVTATHMLWHTPRKEGRDEPSPVVVGGVLLVSNMAGVLSGYDAKTGKPLWKERIGKAPITASPIAVDGRAYLTYEDGETVVVEPTTAAANVVARNKIGSVDGEKFRSSLAAVGGHLYVRSDRAIYCVK